MKKMILILLFLVFPLAGCYSQNQPAPVGKAEVGDTNVWDFGQVSKDRVLQHTFTVKNDGNQPLQIKDVTTSCGCTASKIGKMTLLPGESTTLDVSFNTAHYSGKVQQFAYVHTDNLANPVIKYTIKAEVVQRTGLER